jgi:hypothetical protein
LDLLLNPGTLTVNGTAMSIRNFAAPLPDDSSNPMSAIVFTPEYNTATSGQNGVANAPRAPEFNETGAFHQDPLIGAKTDLTGFPDVFFVRMMAKQATPAGQPLQIAGDPADSDQHDVAIRSQDPADPNVVLPLTDEQVFLRPTTLTISPAGQPEFFNPHNPLDVNGDNSVSAADALTVINTINAGNTGALSGTPQRGQLVDTNMDGMLSPMDVLGVVNYLNAFLVSHASQTSTAPAAGGEGEGEGEASTDLALLGTSDSSSSSASSSAPSAPMLLATSSSSTTSASATSATSSTTSGSQEQSCPTSTLDAGAADELYATLGDTELNPLSPKM